MSAKTTKADERKRCVDVLRSYFCAGAVRPMVVTDFSRSIRRCRLLVPAMGRDGLEVVDVTYFLATASGERMNDRGIPFGGGGYSAALETMGMLARLLGADLQAFSYDELRVS